MTAQEPIWSDNVSQLKLKSATICSESDSIRVCIDKMQAERDPFLVILDANGKLSGVFTERDVMNCYVGTNLSDETMVMAVMNRRVVSTFPQECLRNVIDQMGALQVSQMPVIENKKVMGVITVEAIWEYLGDTFPQELVYLPSNSGQSLLPLQRHGG